MIESDVHTVHIPKKLVVEATRRGYDIEALITDVLIEKLELDPKEEVDTRIEVAEHFLKEAREYIEKGDAVQASEKLYKVAEECIKALAIKFKMPEVEEAKREGRWWTKLLARASAKLASTLNEPIILHGWSTAYNLHVWGFHEMALDIDSVKASLPTIEQLLAKTRELIKR